MSTNKIVQLTVRGGCVHDEYIPPGVTVRVTDYDCHPDGKPNDPVVFEFEAIESTTTELKLISALDFMLKIVEQNPEPDDKEDIVGAKQTLAEAKGERYVRGD